LTGSPEHATNSATRCCPTTLEKPDAPKAKSFRINDSGNPHRPYQIYLAQPHGLVRTVLPRPTDRGLPTGRQGSSPPPLPNPTERKTFTAVSQQSKCRLTWREIYVAIPAAPTTVSEICEPR
jgi:hypothetical protein